VYSNAQGPTKEEIKLKTAYLHNANNIKERKRQNISVPKPSENTAWETQN